MLVLLLTGCGAVDHIVADDRAESPGDTGNGEDTPSAPGDTPTTDPSMVSVVVHNPSASLTTVQFDAQVLFYDSAGALQHRVAAAVDTPIRYRLPAGGTITVGRKVTANGRSTYMLTTILGANPGEAFRIGTPPITVANVPLTFPAYPAATFYNAYVRSCGTLRTVLVLQGAAPRTTQVPSTAGCANEVLVEATDGGGQPLATLYLASSPAGAAITLNQAFAALAPSTFTMTGLPPSVTSVNIAANRGLFRLASTYATPLGGIAQASHQFFTGQPRGEVYVALQPTANRLIQVRDPDVDLTKPYQLAYSNMVTPHAEATYNSDTRTLSWTKLGEGTANVATVYLDFDGANSRHEWTATLPYNGQTNLTMPALPADMTAWLPGPTMYPNVSLGHYADSYQAFKQYLHGTGKQSARYRVNIRY